MKNMKPHEFAEKIGVSVRTLHRWDKYGILNANRNPSGRRFYTEEQLEQFNPNVEGSSINMIHATVIPAIKIINGDNTLYIESGITVNIMTDGTDFEDEYILCEVLSVTEDEIKIEDDDIPWEYITSISIENN